MNDESLKQLKGQLEASQKQYADTLVLKNKLEGAIELLTLMIVQEEKEREKKAAETPVPDAVPLAPGVPAV